MPRQQPPDALAFYRDGLGFDSSGVVGAESRDTYTDAAGAIAVFNLQGGLILCVYPRSELAKDAGVPCSPPKSGEFSISHAVADVDAVLARAEAAGATLLDKPHDRPWGIYSGYFQDRRSPMGDHARPGPGPRPGLTARLLVPPFARGATKQIDGNALADRHRLEDRRHPIMFSR